MITVGISSFTQERNSAKGRGAVTRRHIHYAQDVSAQRKTSLTFRFDWFYYHINSKAEGTRMGCLLLLVEINITKSNINSLFKNFL